MVKNWGDNKFFKIIDEFIISPLGYFSNKYGKIAITVSTICICLFITRPINNIVELPKVLEDTVGDIPIIEHWDDGKVEIMAEDLNRNYDNIYSGWGEGGMSRAFRQGDGLGRQIVFGTLQQSVRRTASLRARLC